MKRLILSTSALCLMAACDDAANREIAVSDPAAEEDLGSDVSPDRPDFKPGSKRAADGQVDFTAIGQEPGWILELTAGQDVTIEWQYATKSATFPFEQTDDMEGPLDLSMQSGSDTLELTVIREDCMDPMNGSEYAYSVTAVINSERLRGCGEWLTE
ncbi:hypothetical protein FF098_001255 [Parvularcula flava]|uniref:Lipoprotein n=1 Tax=Aquisalinus luteolus TaxID=1566827 RepID=A0A8J3A4N3_9PROT|nr:hypothetical protein [Aquisalinus luteolus]NHK26530.1 hypothetical protein [Aquisalinus luteolus]GGH92619.1 hypothetical protein GCM10011355_02540 [Aquisalinus luteolus]